ncbi:hypothetical protein DFJ77DRAFT_478570 [Powellomyces hirtus]|nr:hypothetical protein DFJ77DRAFT_478570 [Powellomyces hirtus]
MPQQQQQQQQPQIPLHETQPIISRPTEIFVPPQQTSFQSLLASPIEQDDLLDASIQQLSVNPDDWELFQQVAVTPDANLPIPPSFSSPAPIPTPLNEQAQYQSNTHQNTNVATQGLDRNRPIAQPSGYSLLPAHVSHRNSYPTGNNVNSGGNNSYNLPQQFQHTRLIHLDHKRLSHTSTAPYKNPTVSPVSPPLPAKRKSSSGSSATIASAADPTSAALTLVEPAAKTSSRRRKAVECMEECSSCGNPLALFNIRGPCKLINQGIIIETTCSECLKDGESSTMLSDNARRNSAQLPNSRQPSRKTRLPSASTGVPLSPFLISQQLECEICKSQFGFASVRPVHTEDAAAAASVTVEVVCKPCKEKWSFCTECGGGGKYRTGKYRPIELFPPSRRTCTLSHFRVGGAELVFQVYQGQDLPLDQLWAFADIFQDAFLSLYATPKIMRQVPAFATLASLKTFVTHAWKNAIGEVLSPNPSSLMWFCASGWIAHPTRAKAKGHRQSSSPRIETSVNPEGEKTLATTAAPEDPSPPPEGPSRSYVGLCAAQYLPETRSLYIAELAVLQSTQVQGIAQKLIFHTLDRLQASLGTWTPPPPPSSASDQQQQQEQLYQHSNDSNTLPVRYVWLLTRKVNIPMQRFAEKKGFLQKKAFITTYPHTKDVVDQFVKEGYSLDEYLTFVARVEDLVR